MMSRVGGDSNGVVSDGKELSTNHTLLFHYPTSIWN